MGGGAGEHVPVSASVPTPTAPPHAMRPPTRAVRCTCRLPRWPCPVAVAGAGRRVLSFLPAAPCVVCFRARRLQRTRPLGASGGARGEGRVVLTFEGKY